MRFVLVALAALALPACAGKLEKATRTQAAADFKCDADKLKVRGDEVYGKYHVAGCGQKGVYSAQCLMGDCSAQRLQGE
ncbi:hypothetical protein [Nannocystis punicea]|uniref:Lipoprotein n=1 Tax=Nannocystis punicea TaxID=2995304 RepID=A0ABY7GTA7_9BACT|nr:hypothetical protein [Nannocystis poenicansa]WAS90143.1 hypothetical protein O0S08_28445 [Nannocystis poenicansa]